MLDADKGPHTIDARIMPAELGRPALRRNAIHQRTGHLVSRPLYRAAPTTDIHSSDANGVERRRPQRR
jgi:hypothetical protein